MNTKDSSPSVLARRLVKMGLSRNIPEFPPDGISLVELVRWCLLWPRDPRRNLLDSFGAAVYPAVACGFVALEPRAPLAQAVFAATLPINKPATAVTQWTEWVIGSIVDESYPGPAPLLGVLEHLLRNRFHHFAG